MSELFIKPVPMTAKPDTNRTDLKRERTARLRLQAAAREALHRLLQAGPNLTKVQHQDLVDLLDSALSEEQP